VKVPLKSLATRLLDVDETPRPGALPQPRGQLNLPLGEAFSGSG